jgi:7-cyano-7-deazaguanine synthase
MMAHGRALMKVEPRCVVLLSGGLDSATTLAVAVRERKLLATCLSFEYGQRHAHELACAARVASALGAASHRVLRIDASIVAGSALTGGGGAVPKGRDLDDAGAGIPATYVPARNTLFLAHGLAEAERIGAPSIFIGANEVDYSGYPDCRPAFLAAFEALANLATREAVEGRARFRIEAPLLALSKADIVRRALALGVPLELTSSCYDPASDGSPCRECDSCRLRAKGFAEAGAVDPLLGRP